MTDDDGLQQEARVALALARDAAAAIRDVQAEAQKNPREKSGGQGPVTDADLAADRVLSDGLRRAFPDDLVVTEETWVTGSSLDLQRRTWFCDPLDGTQEFIRGRDDFVVMVGLVIDGQPRLGVLVHPATGDAWLGVTGDQARCERRPASGEVVAASVATRSIGSDGPVAVVSRSHPGRLTRYVAELVGGRVVKRGSVGLKIAMIVDDEADLYLSGSRRMKVWDTAGPAAILMAAGGELTALDGSKLSYGEDATHHAGVRAWTPAAATLLRERIDAAVESWRRGDQAAVASLPDDDEA